MRVFLACVNKSNCWPETLLVIKPKLKYLLTSYIEGSEACAYSISLVGKENFLLDSGAYSYMSGKQCTKEQLREYLQGYISFINEYDVQNFFELDVDTIFGLDFVEELRQELEEKTGKQCIPVWHKGRGIE